MPEGVKYCVSCGLHNMNAIEEMAVSDLRVAKEKEQNRKRRGFLRWFLGPDTHSESDWFLDE